MNVLRVAILDLDGTLTDFSDSWGRFNTEMHGSEERRLQIYSDYLTGAISYPQSKAEMLALWRQNGDTSRAYIEKVFAGWPIRPEAPLLMEALRKHKITSCIITGGFKMHAEAVARKLGIPTVYADMELLFDTKGYLKDYDYHQVLAPQKLMFFHRYLEQKRLSPEECLAIGDDINDIGLFKATGHGILLSQPGQNLELRQAAWRIIDSLVEVRQLL